MSFENRKPRARRQYSADAKAAGIAMLEVLRHYKTPLSVQDARDACSYARSSLEYDVRTCPYNDPNWGFEDELHAEAGDSDA